MLFALSLATSQAFTCPDGGADPVCDTVRQMVTAANAAYPGSDPIVEGAGRQMDEDRVLARLRRSLDDMVARGCLVDPAADTWVAGSYGVAPSTGSQDGTPLSSIILDRDTKRVSVTGLDSFGETFGTYNKQKQVVADYSGGDYAYGFFVRVLGTRGVFFAFGNTCDGSVDAGTALAGLYRGDVSPLLPASDGVCLTEGDPDCDGICDLLDPAGGPDCDGICDLLVDDLDSADCEQGLGDCDVFPGSPECCSIEPFHPSCLMDVCSVFPGSPECCTDNPLNPSCGFDPCLIDPSFCLDPCLIDPSFCEDPCLIDPSLPECVF